MKFYRIKQIAEDAYIPQVSTSVFNKIFGIWHGIDIINRRILSIEEYQRKWCVSATLNHAKSVIIRYKENSFKSTKYPKYYSLQKQGGNK